jgi:poly-gamma-glutamate synthesis protein (capsule biosynthesis protein)
MKIDKLPTGAADGELVMLLVGDVFVQRDDPASVFDHVRDTLRRTDFLLGNLEGSVADSGVLWSVKETQWKADARQIQAAESVGFDAMAAANNHMLDFGHDAMLETLGHLDRLGIAHSGAGRNFDEAHRPGIVEKQGCRVALLGYTSVFMPEWAAESDKPGLAVMRARTAYEAPSRVHEVPGTPPIVRTWMVTEDKVQLAADIKAARRANADIVVCSFHWGVSRGHREIADYQIELGRHAIDCGADIVFGHHPHVTQGVEVYRDRPIFYSLGNFTFAQHNPAKGHEAETMIVKCRIRDRRIVGVEYLPVVCDAQANPHLRTPETGSEVVALLTKRSARFGTEFRINDSSVELVIGHGQATQRQAAL